MRTYGNEMIRRIDLRINQAISYRLYRFLEEVVRIIKLPHRILNSVIVTCTVNIAQKRISIISFNILNSVLWFTSYVIEQREGN